ncbi:hypothetical protein GII33_15650 [Gordonia pseudamarae]|jgi:hypothetical protein|uniref:ABC transporter n=1 Tax=Gordonia pseudamarae TaxID=2831662 RepID=A0ABX6IJK1_9ACTN|nr:MULTISPECIES: hypothetical protein [Gordonia]MBD0023033.1 hypothetical protein [Gordonia sp. (in: high G+C Gram-positive bacteria)]QHN27170.1 hypothetical protein GII33_15650 [Gordonia pseudamarae]QHN36060.1 hypothetical protein GII31_15475 [Gordonia pseudamarae]
MDLSSSGTSPRALVGLPFRMGFAITGVVLTASESAVNIARVTADSVQNEINQSLGIDDSDELGVARTPIALLTQLADLLGPDRPFGRILAAGGPLERLLVHGGVIDRLVAKDGLLEKATARGGLLDQITAEDGILMRVAAQGGPIDRLTREGGVIDQITDNEGILERLTTTGGVLDKLTAPDGVLDKISAPGGILDRMVEDDGLLEQLVGEGGAVERAIAPGGPLDRIAELTEMIGQLAPTLIAMQDTVHELSATVDLLTQSVAPLGGLAERLPKRLTAKPRTPVGGSSGHGQSRALGSSTPEDDSHER